jgi:hypothetical protein
MEMAVGGRAHDAGETGAGTHPSTVVHEVRDLDGAVATGGEHLHVDQEISQLHAPGPS